MATTTTRDAALTVTEEELCGRERERGVEGEIIPYFGIVQKLNSRMKDLSKVNSHELQSK